MKSRLISFLKIAFAVGILVWLARSDYLNFADLKRALDPVYLPLATLGVLAMLLSAAERFRFLLKAQGVSITVRHNLELFFIGQFFNFILPGGVGGDVVKAFYLHKDVGHHAKTSPYTVLFDRFIGFYVLAIMGVIVVLLQWSRFMLMSQLHALSIAMILVFLALTLIIVLGFWRKSREFIVKIVPQRLGPARKFMEHIASSCEYYSAHPHFVLRSLIWGTVMQIFAILALAAVGAALHLEAIPLSAYFFIGPLGYIVTSLPIAPAGIGIGQAGFLYFFNAYLGHKSPLGPLSITVLQILSLLWSLIGLYFYLARRSGPRVPYPNPEPHNFGTTKAEPT